MEYESESMRELIENTEMFFELENVVCQIHPMNLRKSCELLTAFFSQNWCCFELVNFLSVNE